MGFKAGRSKESKMNNVYIKIISDTENSNLSDDFVTLTPKLNRNNRKMEGSGTACDPIILDDTDYSTTPVLASIKGMYCFPLINSFTFFIFIYL
jgi:hypothetical protein